MALTAILNINAIQGMPLPKLYREAMLRDDGIAVHGFEHKLESMIDEKTGLPIKEIIPGSPPAVRHSPLIIRKKVSPSSPALYGAWKDQTVLDGWELRFFHNPLSGPEHDYFIIKLTGAKVSSIKLIKPSMTNPALSQGHEYEDIAFTYTEITWTSPERNIGMGQGASRHQNHHTKALWKTPLWEEQVKKRSDQCIAFAEEMVSTKVEGELIKHGVLHPAPEKK